jgi:hypothetical protein
MIKPENPVLNFPGEAVPGAEEIESRFDTTFLSAVAVEGVSTYVVTREGMNRFFDGTAISRNGVKGAWINLARHSKTLHSPYRPEGCNCELRPFFGEGMVYDYMGIGPKLIGINPIGLASVSPNLPNMPSCYICYQYLYKGYNS